METSATNREVLKEVREDLSWTPGTQRSLVMIGDAPAHEPNYKRPKNEKIDWRVESDRLFNEMGVHVYAVHCGGSYGEAFFKDVAKRTDGTFLKLNQMQNVFDMLMAICYREHGADLFHAYEHEVRGRGLSVAPEMDKAFDRLRPDGSAAPSSVKVGKPSLMKKTSSFREKSAKKTVKVVAKAPAAKVLAKAKKAAKKTSVATKKTVSTADERAYRERIPQTRFAFNGLEWSRWTKAISPNKPKVGEKNWSPLPKCYSSKGYRRRTLFKGDTRRYALYEFAVRTPASPKKVVIYFRCTTGFSIRWDTYLLRQRNVTAQIDDVLRKGCDIYVRRALLKKTVRHDGKTLSAAEEVRRHVASKYEYAWNKRLYGKRRCRDVSVKSISVSSAKY